LAAVTTSENVQGFCGPPSACRGFGRPFGNLNDARDQNQRVPEAEQTLTGWLNVTTVATSNTSPLAQLGLQSSSLYVPVPSASVADQLDHFILYRNAVESPDSGQPKLDVQAGSYSGVRFVSWLGARKVLVPDGEAVTLEVTDGAAVAEAGAVGDPVAVGDPADVGDPAAVPGTPAAVELADELQAVTSKAAQANPAHKSPARESRARESRARESRARESPARESPARESTAPAAARRAFRDLVINIDSCPF